MRFQVTLLPDEDGWIVAEVPALPGCITQGSTRAEALVNIRDAIQGWLKVRLMRLVDECTPAREECGELVEIEV
jgi:predicted RNase H-like HicB family nuclease